MRQFLLPLKRLSGIQLVICGFVFFLPFLVVSAILESPFEFIKMIYTTAGFLALFGYWAVRLLNQPKFELRWNIFLSAMLAYLGAVLLAFAFARNHYVSFWGDVNLPAGSTLSFIVYIGLTFLILQFSASRRLMLFLLGAFAVNSVLLGVHSIIQHFELDPMDWWGYRSFSSRTFATIGQAVALGVHLATCSYLLLAAVFTGSGKVRTGLAYFGWFSINLGLLYTGSRAPILASVLMSCICFAVIYRFRSRIRHYSLRKLVVVMVLFGATHLIYYVEAVNNTLAEKMQTEQLGSGFRSRLVAWEAAIEIFKKNPIVGVGPEQFVDEYNLIRSKDSNYNESWLNNWTKAHNEFVQVLCTTGLLGILTYLFFIFLFYYKSGRLLLKKRFLHFKELTVALVAGYSLLLLTNILAFNLSTTMLLLFLMPAALSQLTKSRVISVSNKLSIAFRRILQTFVVLVCLQGAYFLGLHFWANYNFSEATKAFTRQNFGGAHRYNQEAIAADPYYSRLYCFQASIYFEGFRDIVQRKIKYEDSQVIEMFHEMDEASDKCIQLSPQSNEAWRNRGLLYLEASRIKKESIEKSIVSYKRAIELFPTSPKTHYDMALAYILKGDYDLGVASLKDSIFYKNDYFPSLVKLVALYYELNRRSEVPVLLKAIDLKYLRSDEGKMALQEFGKIATGKGDKATAELVQNLYRDSIR